MPNVVLRWRGAVDADGTTNYRIEADKVTPGTFTTVATQAATSPYVPVSSMLNGSLTSTVTTIILADGTNFSAGDYVTVGQEVIQLGTKSTNTFSSCLRGLGSTSPIAHDNLATVYKAHESYTDSAVSFGSRFLIRYHIIRVQGTTESVVSEIVAVNPPIPDTTDMCVVWGIIQDLTGDVQVGESVTMTIGGPNDYLTGTAENIRQSDETTSTDNDGFFSFQVPRSASRAINTTITIVAAEKTWTLNTVPDQNFVNINAVP